MPQDNQHSQGTPNVKQQTRTTVELPHMYRVIFHNDDITTMDFVVEVLEKVFRKSTAEATSLMLQVHTQGQAAVGTYTYDIAVTRRNKAKAMARAEGFPLRITIEPE